MHWPRTTASRPAIRGAWWSLRRDGLTTAARGRTSTVAEPMLIEQSSMGWRALQSLRLGQAADLTQRTSIVRKLDVRAAGVVAARLGLEESTRLVHLVRLCRPGRNHLPVSWSRPLLEVEFTHVSLCEQMNTRYGIGLTGGHERIRGRQTRGELRLLQNPAEVAAPALDRLGCSDGVPTVWRHTLILTDRCSLTAQFTPTSYRSDSNQPLTAVSLPIVIATGDRGVLASASWRRWRTSPN